MGGMPYHLEKGAIFATMEALFDDKAELSKLLRALWDRGEGALGSLGAITSPTADDPTGSGSSNATPDKRVGSMRRDWFGDRDGNPQPPWGDPSPGKYGKAFTTGYWAHYYGNVRKIVAETLMRAGEVSLGIDRPDPIPETVQGTRHWPVEFFWKCGQPRFEGWVTWRDNSKGRSGQVTVIFATPATPDQVHGRPDKEGRQVTSEEWETVGEGPWQQHWQGMWVCSHEDHRQHVMVTPFPTMLGNWIVPFDAVMFTEGTGEVGTWAPRFGSGGAAPNGPLIFQHGSENR